MATRLAKRMEQISGSPSSALIARVAELRRQGENIVGLNIGEPDFGTPPAAKVAGIKAICENFTKYTPGAGIAELREEIIKKLKRDNGLTYDMNEIAVTVGAKQAIANALLALVDEGDEVLLPVPCWVSYTEMVKLANATPVFVPVHDDYTLDLDAIEAAITPNTRAIVICTPNNPTGAVYSRESLQKLADLAIEHDFMVIADEIYERLIYDGYEHVSIASLSQEAWEHTITVNGMSKAFAMTGWRIGYAAGNKTVLKAMKALQTQQTSATSAISQKAAVDALKYAEPDVEAMVAEFAKRRDHIMELIEGTEGFSCPTPHGAFYAYVDVTPLFGKKAGDQEITSSMDLAAYLLDDAKVALLPGENFGLGGRIRMSYATSMENLDEAFKRMRASLAKLS